MRKLVSEATKQAELAKTKARLADLIRDIEDYNPSWDTDFLKSLLSQIDEKGWLSDKQLQALENVEVSFQSSTDRGW